MEIQPHAVQYFRFTSGRTLTDQCFNNSSEKFVIVYVDVDFM